MRHEKFDFLLQVWTERVLRLFWVGVRLCYVRVTETNLIVMKFVLWLQMNFK
jgi:hypothetical protein